MSDNIIYELSLYQNALGVERRISRRIELFRESQSSIQINLDGLPKSTIRKTQADYIVRLEELENELADAVEARKEAYRHVSGLIERLESEGQKDILDLRYIAGLSWQEIAQELGTSKSNVRYRHNRAVESLAPFSTF